MATTQSTIDFLLDQLRPLGDIRAKKMFGEYALYCEEKVVALVCDNQLFVKITPVGVALVGERYEEGRAYPGAKPSMLISADDLEDHERLCELISATAAALPPPKPKTTKAGAKPKAAVKVEAATKPRAGAKPKAAVKVEAATKPKAAVEVEAATKPRAGAKPKAGGKAEAAAKPKR